MVLEREGGRVYMRPGLGCWFEGVRCISSCSVGLSAVGLLGVCGGQGS